MLKNVIQVVPTYAMGVFLLSKMMCYEIENLMNSFWWGTNRRDSKGIHWSTWQKLRCPKKWGGMNFRKLREFNLVMLGKQLWRFLQYLDSLVCKVYKAKYFPHQSIFDAKLGSNPSYIW